MSFPSPKRRLTFDDENETRILTESEDDESSVFSRVPSEDEEENNVEPAEVEVEEDEEDEQDEEYKTEEEEEDPHDDDEGEEEPIDEQESEEEKALEEEEEAIVIEDNNNDGEEEEVLLPLTPTQVSHFEGISTGLGRLLKSLVGLADFSYTCRSCLFRFPNPTTLRTLVAHVLTPGVCPCKQPLLVSQLARHWGEVVLKQTEGVVATARNVHEERARGRLEERAQKSLCTLVRRHFPALANEEATKALVLEVVRLGVPGELVITCEDVARMEHFVLHTDPFD